MNNKNIKFGVVEMRMLSDYIRKDKIQNDHIRERVVVAPIAKKMVENRLR